MHDSVLKNGASVRDPALRGFRQGSHTMAYAALDERPRALADGLMLAFQHPVRHPAGTISGRNAEVLNP
jgi:hypothetical protein